MATTKELMAQTQKAVVDYFELSKYLFGDDAPQDVNEIPESNRFYELAKSIADEMELDWEKMSHKDSNRVMLNMLGDLYYGIRTDEEYTPVLSVSIQRTVTFPNKK